MKVKLYPNQKLKRAVRVRSKINGTAQRPRLSIFRSNKYLFAQLINDQESTTILGISSKSLKSKKKLSKTEKAALLGEELAKQAKDANITQVVLDRGPNRYHGRIKSLAQAARKAGLKI